MLTSACLYISWLAGKLRLEPKLIKGFHRRNADWAASFSCGWIALTLGDSDESTGHLSCRMPLFRSLAKLI